MGYAAIIHMLRIATTNSYLEHCVDALHVDIIDKANNKVRDKGLEKKNIASAALFVSSLQTQKIWLDLLEIRHRLHDYKPCIFYGKWRAPN